MKNISKYGFLALCATLPVATGLTSCNDDDFAYQEIIPGEVTTIQDPDTPISEVNLGDLIAIRGAGMDIHNIDSIKVNDVPVDLNEVYTEDNILYMKVPIQLPAENVGKIFIFNRKGMTEVPITINIPPLKLDRMFNEYTRQGDTIMVYGQFFNLYEIDSLTAYADFDGLKSKIITHGDTYFTTRVPKETPDNVILKLVSTKYDTSAQCPGRYRDQRFLVYDFDHSLGNGYSDDNISDYPQYIETDPTDKNRISGNYLHVHNGNITITGWDYIAGRNHVYWEDAMMDYPSNVENYVMKCEFKTNNQMILDKIGFYCVYYWALPAQEWPADCFNVQRYGVWETITLPFTLNPDGYGPTAIWSFDIRFAVDPAMSFDFAFDNIRVCPKGD